MNSKSAIRSVGNAEHYLWGQQCDGWFLHRSESMTAIQERMPQGTTEQLHCHRLAQQFFYILSGTATFEVDGYIQILTANQSIHVPAKALHRISNNDREDLVFLLVSQPDAHDDRIEIVDFTEGLEGPVKTLNTEWLEKYFRVEPIDEVMLSNPKGEIIDKGGRIFYARWNGEIVGTANLLKVENTIFELGKMAVTDSVQGKGIGHVLMEHVLHVAEKMKIGKLILYSNTKLKSAIHLYEKYGFKEIPLEQGLYERANIKMEKIL